MKEGTEFFLSPFWRNTFIKQKKLEESYPMGNPYCSLNIAKPLTTKPLLYFAFDMHQNVWSQEQKMVVLTKICSVLIELYIYNNIT